MPYFSWYWYTFCSLAFRESIDCEVVGHSVPVALVNVGAHVAVLEHASRAVSPSTRYPTPKVETDAQVAGSVPAQRERSMTNSVLEETAHTRDVEAEALLTLVLKSSYGLISMVTVLVLTVRVAHSERLFVRQVTMKCVSPECLTLSRVRISVRAMRENGSAEAVSKR